MRALEHLEAARPEKKNVIRTEHLTVIDLFEGPWLVGTRLRR